MKYKHFILSSSAFILTIVLGVVILGAPKAAHAQAIGAHDASTGATTSTGQLPAILRGVTFDQELGRQVPLNTTFKDEHGNTVVLKQYFGKTPVVLIMAYYRCPLLCPEVLHGAVTAFKKINFRIGKQFQVLTVSINPAEGPALAEKTKKTYIGEYGNPAAGAGWHFLTGKNPQIKQVADAVGFHYRYIPKLHQFAHAAGIVVLTPQGKVAQYFYGIKYSPENLRLALVQSSHDKIGSVVDQVLLYCCTYDPDTGRYQAIITRVLAIAGGITILLIGGAILILVRWDSKRRRRAPQGA